MTNEAWLDAAVFQCPSCGRFYVDASWYAITLESDIECRICHTNFNPKKRINRQGTPKICLGQKGCYQRNHGNQAPAKQSPIESQVLWSYLDRTWSLVVSYMKEGLEEC